MAPRTDDDGRCEEKRYKTEIDERKERGVNSNLMMMMIVQDKKRRKEEHKLGFKEQNKKTNHSAKPIVLLFIRNEDD